MRGLPRWRIRVRLCGIHTSDYLRSREFLHFTLKTLPPCRRNGKITIRSTRLPFSPGPGATDNDNSIRAGLALVPFDDELNRVLFRMTSPTPRSTPRMCPSISASAATASPITARKGIPSPSQDSGSSPRREKFIPLRMKAMGCLRPLYAFIFETSQQAHRIPCRMSLQITFPVARPSGSCPQF